MKLETISRETMLRSAHRFAQPKYLRCRFLWAFVMDICCVGSTSAYAICRELGWDPDAKASSTLPPRKTDD